MPISTLAIVSFVLFGIALFGGIYAFAMIGIKNREKRRTGLGVAVVFTLLAVGIMFGTGAYLTLVPPEVPTDEIPPEQVGCVPGTITPSVTIKGKNFDTGDAVTGAIWYSYRLTPDDVWAEVALGSANTDLRPCQTYEICVGCNGSSGSPLWYGEYFDLFIPAEEIYPVTTYVYNVSNTGLSETIVNSDSVTTNAVAAASNQVIVAGDSVAMRWTIKAISNAHTGNPYVLTEFGNYPIFYIKYNTTEVDLIEITELAGVITCPLLTSTTGFAYKCWNMEILGDLESTVLYPEITADTTYGVDTDMTIGTKDSQYYMNTNTQEIEGGVENNDQGTVGVATEWTHTVYFNSTA